MKPLSFLTLLRLLRTVTNGRTKTTSLLVNNSYSSLQHSGCIYNGRITNDDRISIIDSISSEIHLVIRCVETRRSVLSSFRRNHARLYPYASLLK